MNSRQSLSHLCLREDAQKKIGGLSPVAPDIVTIVLRDAEFWPAIEQGIKVMKPIVDLIGDEESCDSSLASCMLGLIRLAKTISQLPIEEGDNVHFWQHAKAVFNRHFFAMNTKTHSLVLFLHPMCRKLAISQAINGRSFKFMVEVALDIAKQWRWSEQLAKMLVADLKDYHKCSGVFSGGQADALDWWETLPISAERCPLKAFAIIIHSIVPHAADIECYFSGLGGVQSVKCCNLSVQTFESLSKLRASYANFLHKVGHEAGKPACCKHAHMHTRPEHGLDTALADELQRSFAWVPPLAGASHNSDDKFLAGLSSLHSPCHVWDMTWAM